MSWFDASKFSKYAKTALKQAQKNIDKVLDISEEDDSTSKITNTGSTAPAQIISSPKSPTYVVKESDSFFDSFLGNDIKKQVSNYLTPTNSIASIEVSSNDVIDTSQRKGRLKDRSKRNSSEAIVRNNSFKGNSTDEDDSLSPSRSKRRDSQDASPSLCASLTIEGNSSSPETKANKSFDIIEDDLFDDIDLTDSDIDIADISSNISDESDIHGTVVQNHLPTIRRVVESLNEDEVINDDLKVNNLDDNVDSLNEVPVDSKDSLTKDIIDILVSPTTEIEKTNEVTNEEDNSAFDNNDIESVNIPCDEDILHIDNSNTLDTVTIKEEEDVLLPKENVDNEINLELTDQLTKDEDISIETDKLIDNNVVSEHIPENIDIEIKSEELLDISNDEPPENKPIFSSEVEDISIEVTSNDTTEGNIVVETEESIDTADDSTFESYDTCVGEFSNKSIDIIDDCIPEGNIDVKTNELIDAADENEHILTSELSNNTVDNKCSETVECKDILVKTEELIDALNENEDVLTSELPNEPIDINSKETLESNDIVVETDFVDNATDIDVKLPSTLNEDFDGLQKSNEEILTEAKPSDSYQGFLDADSNDMYSSLVNNESNENQTQIACESYDEEVKTTDSLTTDSNDSNGSNDTNTNQSLQTIDSFTTDSGSSDTTQTLQTSSSLVNIDIPNSDSSSLCIVKEPEYDHLENIMKRTESELLSASEMEVATPCRDLPESTCPPKDSVSNDQLESNANDVPASCHPTAPFENEINQQHIEEVNQLNEKIEGLNKEVKELQSVIDAREMQMIELSKQNISFQESVSVYQSQIQQLEQVNQADDEEMENMRQEFIKRIAESDSNCQAALKERDQSKATLIEVEASLRQSTNEQVSVLTNSLLEKEETIKDLLNEGEALSKKELESNQRIKKLRIKLKEVTNNNATLTEQISGFGAETQKLKDFIKDKENNESRLENELKKLEGITDSQEDEVSALKEQLDDMEEKYKTMESTLHNTYAEINRLNLENAQKDSAMQESSFAIQEKKQLEEKLKELEKHSKYGKEELLTQLEDLQLAYSRLEQQLSRREDELKKEIEDMHKRLEHGEHRNQELSQSVSAATKPLLRQIGNLQSNYSIQSESWERVEKNLTDRLISLQDQLALAMEKERMASEIAIEAKAKLKAVQTQQTSLKQEKTNLQISLEDEMNKCNELGCEWKRERSSYETKLSKLKIVTMELEGEKKVLEEQMTAERIKYENETLRMSTQLSLQQRQSQQPAQFGNPSSHASSRTSSICGDSDSASQDMSVNSSPIQRYLSSSSSYHDGFQKGATTTTAASVEHLKSQLRSREGEVFVLQEEIKGLEKTKASLAQELVNLANRVEELEASDGDLEKLKEEYKDLKSRYNAVLQMYGEKAEEAEELKMDIEDVKNMYRQQIQELCGGR